MDADAGAGAGAESMERSETRLVVASTASSIRDEGERLKKRGFVRLR